MWVLHALHLRALPVLPVEAQAAAAPQHMPEQTTIDCTLRLRYHPATRDQQVKLASGFANAGLHTCHNDDDAAHDKRGGNEDVRAGAWVDEHQIRNTQRTSSLEELQPQ